MTDRFAYDVNLKRATKYREWSRELWPPLGDYCLTGLDLDANLPILGRDFYAELEVLRAGIEAECLRCGGKARRHLHDTTSIAACLRRLAALLPREPDRRALSLRAEAVESGYDEAALAALKDLDEVVTVFAGCLSTWYGKQVGGLPTSFAGVRDETHQRAVVAVGERLDDARALLFDLHKALSLGDVPAFTALRLFFMAGEGNGHPKHIAYFLPEDEGVKRSPFKKTYYFTNTHRELIDAATLPLARRFLDLGRAAVPCAEAYGDLPTLGVLAHEVGHFVHREGTDYTGLNAVDRWASIALQETAADVFGSLFLARAFGLDAATAVAYHLGECLRYVDRGLGSFPDSDGMYLQLQYLASFGALTVERGTGRLSGDVDVIIAGYRSMARVLADTLLAGDVDRSLAFYRAYGPPSDEHLRPLIEALRREPPKSIEYLQEGRCAAAEGTPVDATIKGNDKEPLREFYCGKVAGTSLTRYEIWERGEACGDSVTPSAYCPEYRTHMVQKIMSSARAAGNGAVFSIGCGNAFVEAELVARGLRLEAIDLNAEAVDLAAGKGVTALTADVAELPDGRLSAFGTIYADGLLGHLYSPEDGLERFFRILGRLAPPRGAWLVLSNDGPNSDAPVTPHGGLLGFWLFSPDYLRETVTKFGWRVTEFYSFPYERPVSGLRKRTICIATGGGR